MVKTNLEGQNVSARFTTPRATPFKKTNYLTASLFTSRFLFQCLLSSGCCSLGRLHVTFIFQFYLERAGINTKTLLVSTL